MSFLNKRDRAQRNGHQDGPCQEGKVKGDYAAIGEFVSAGNWSDGTVRVPGTLLVCTGEGLWRAWLNDRDGEVAAWVTADTLQALLDAVEEGLRENTLHWRSVAPRQKPKK